MTRDAASNPLNMSSGADTAWTTANAGEVMPGVMYPLGWTFWGDGVNVVMQRTFQSLGLLAAREIRALDPAVVDQRFLGIFAGRACVNVTLVRQMGDRLPGSTGDSTEKQMFGGLNSGLANAPTRHRYPFVLVELPITAIRAVRGLRSARTNNERHWHQAIARPPRTLEGAQELLRAAMQRFESTMVVHLQNTMIAQALYDRVGDISGSAGDADRPALSTGYGEMEETAVLQDIWELAHGSSTLELFLSRHGYHGPREGDITSRCWREDPSPIVSLIERYRGLAAERSPREVERGRIEMRRAAEDRFLAGMPAAQRPIMRLLLRWTAQAVLRRQIGKVAFLYAIDEARIAARAAGQMLHAQGLIRTAEDVAYLTVEELAAAQDIVGLHDSIARRTETRRHYLDVDIPRHWIGNPVLAPVDRARSDLAVAQISGLPVSNGIAEGNVRVVADPYSESVEQGDILVCSTTDPSWVPLMFLAGAVVVDIGGPMSHAAILARELGIPCVVNTIEGSRRLRDGDRVRVDGSTGQIVAVSAAG